MKRKLPILGLLFICVFANFSCKKNRLELSGQEGITLVLLDKYTSDKTTWAIDESSLKLGKKPLISYKDILSYDQNTHTFLIADEVANAIGALENNGHGLAFAILADGKLIYTAYFWASFSSTSCDWVVVDPIAVKISKRLRIQLGYASPTNGQLIPDRRNDERILSVLKRDGKLLE